MFPPFSEPSRDKSGSHNTENRRGESKDHFTVAVDYNRYRKLKWFFAKIFLHVLFWDVLLTLPILRIFRTSPLGRWQKIARDYRKIALAMGGVLIKLGQFLSIRVDILPPEVTGELAGLQDNVPSEPSDAVIKQIETHFGRPMSDIFRDFNKEPIGAASLAQVHQVVLISGKPAVVKVLRPGIHILVETDLAAIRKAIGWLKLYKKVRQRVDLDWLIDEFTAVTRKELDLMAEGKNAERLANDFSNDPFLYIPEIYWEYCNTHILTMEKVDFFKIDDLVAIREAGVSSVQVADQLYRIYMQQVFETFFAHVDPHPGNLFVKPVPTQEEINGGIADFVPGDPVPYRAKRQFKIVFVDFGMAVTIPERLRNSLREYVIGLGTRDAHKIVQAYITSGALPAHENVERIEEAHEVLFDRLWGVRVGRFRSLAVSEARFFLKEYRDVIYNAPFQFQADMLFVVRAVGILSGLATHLDPDFDPWTKSIPYAERFAKAHLNQGWLGWQKEMGTIALHLLKLPEGLDRVLTQTRQGKLTVRNSFSPDAKKQIQRLENSIRCVGWMVLSASLLISGILLHLQKPGAGLDWAILGCAFIAFLRGIKKG